LKRIIIKGIKEVLDSFSLMVVFISQELKDLEETIAAMFEGSSSSASAMSGEKNMEVYGVKWKY